jgi:hypothetical protein
MARPLLMPPKKKLLSRRKLIRDGAAAVSLFNIIKSREGRAQSPCGNSSAPTPPPQATAAGFTSLVFEDDFTTNTTFAIRFGQAYTPGVNWYQSFQGGQTTTVNTTMTAAQVNNGNTGGGSNASPNGGIVSLQAPPGDKYKSWITVPGGYLNNGSAVRPPVGQGNWNHFYVEQYTQFNITTAATTGSINSWPSFWSWTVEGLGNFGFGSSSLRTAGPVEWDFFESDGPNFSDFKGVCSSNLANHTPPGTVKRFVKGYPATDGYPAVVPYFDNNWHTIGALWKADPNNAGQGLASFWFDNVNYGPTISTGGVGSAFPLEWQHLFLIICGAAGSPSYVDWVRLWQTPSKRATPCSRHA